MVVCPECESNIDIDEEDVDEGDIISCDECGREFEVVTTNPLELAPVADEEEEEEEEEEEDEESENGDY